MTTRNPLWLAGLIISCAALAYADNPPPKKHALPTDPKTVVILLDTKGGRLLKKNDEPALQIQTDGKVIVGNPFGFSRRAEGKITPEELQSLLAYILDQQDFTKITPDDLQLKGNMVVGDATTTRLVIEADGASQELSARALETVAAQAGPASPAAHLLAITQRLRHLSDETLLGGKEALAQYLAAANQKLKAQFPEEKPLQTEDLQYVTARPTGETSAVFQHKTELPTGHWYITAVTVIQDAQGKKITTAQKGPEQNPPAK